MSRLLGVGDDYDAPNRPQPPSTMMLAGPIVAVLALIVALAASWVLTRSGDESTANDAPAVIDTGRAAGEIDGGTADANAVSSSVAASAPTAAASAAAPVATPTPEPTATPLPTATPVPTATAVPLPTPQPTVAADLDQPRYLPAGPNSLQFRTMVSFELAEPRPARVMPGHTAIYLDDTYVGEVDIFVPYATADGRPLDDADSVAAYIEQDSRFDGMIRDPSNRTLNGYAVTAFLGPVTNELQVGFQTDPGSIGVDRTGWYIPGELTLWVIDGPGGPLVVTAETLHADRARSFEAHKLMGQILSTWVFAADR